MISEDMYSVFCDFL